jgi:hypothetical protein
MKTTAARKTLPAGERDALLATLRARFEQHPQRHAGVAWPDVLSRLEGSPAALRVLQAMESTGGEPDVIGRDAASGAVIFADCSPQSPAGRQSLCYDRAALAGRRKFPPKGCVTERAAELGIGLLDEAQYLALQKLGEFDTKTSSWLKTPPEIRALGGAIYGDRRYNRVFIGHNGADSYYSGRGFRGLLRV